MPFTGCKGVVMVQIGKYFGRSKNMPPSKLYLVLAKVCNTLAHLLCKYPLTLSSPSFLLIIIQLIWFFFSNCNGYFETKKYIEEGNVYMNGSQRRCYKRPLLTDYVFLRKVWSYLALSKFWHCQKGGGSRELPIQIISVFFIGPLLIILASYQQRDPWCQDFLVDLTKCSKGRPQDLLKVLDPPPPQKMTIYPEFVNISPFPPIFSNARLSRALGHSS